MVSHIQQRHDSVFHFNVSSFGSRRRIRANFYSKRYLCGFQKKNEIDAIVKILFLINEMFYNKYLEVILICKRNGNTEERGIYAPDA